MYLIAQEWRWDLMSLLSDNDMKSQAIKIDNIKSARLGEWRLNDFRVLPSNYVYSRSEQKRSK